jgi:hypothetical protein
MWFAIALLIFSAVYAAARLLRGDQEKKGEEAADGTEGAEGTGDDAKLPDHRDVIALVLVIAAAAFAIRLVQPIGTAVLNMQLSFFASYVALFAVGIAARQRRWLERIPYPFGIVWLKAALVGGTAFWLALFLFGIGPEGEISKTYGGLYWQSAAYAPGEASTAWVLASASSLYSGSLQLGGKWVPGSWPITASGSLLSSTR